jgi:hypothetical protein
MYVFVLIRYPIYFCCLGALVLDLCQVYGQRDKVLYSSSLTTLFSKSCLEFQPVSSFLLFCFEVWPVRFGRFAETFCFACSHWLDIIGSVQSAALFQVASAAIFVRHVSRTCLFASLAPIGWI